MERTVIVQAIHSFAEAHCLLELASVNEFVAGVVTWADLTSPGLGRELDELQAHPKFKGIRHQIESEPDDAWMVRKHVLEGFSELERRGIPFDLVIYPSYLKYVPWSVSIPHIRSWLWITLPSLASPTASSTRGRSIRNAY